MTDDDARSAYERDPNSSCRRLGLMCADCLARRLWCDICDYREKVEAVREYTDDE